MAPEVNDFMKRSVPVLVLAGVGAAFVFFSCRGITGPGAPAGVSAEEKGPGIAEFMLVVHDRQGMLPQVRQALTGSGPSDDKAWKAVSARATIIATLGEAILTKKLPKQGDKASWREKVTSYNASAKALANAATAMNLATARTESAKLQKSCNACHKAHQ